MGEVMCAGCVIYSKVFVGKSRRMKAENLQINFIPEIIPGKQYGMAMAVRF